MATPNHLPFINLTYSHLHDHSFEFFPMLTIELRLQIWEYAVQQTRFLKIYLEPLSQDTSTDPYSGLNALNKVVSNVGYTVTVKSLHCSSKLLAVSREARKAALRFYRIQVPCHIKVSEGRRMPSSVQAPFYFNPAYDILHVKSALPLSRTFVPFLHDLRAYDPKDVGILRLALDDELVTNLYHMNPSLAEVAYKSFILSLKTLQQIIWMASSPIGRPITGVRSNLPTVGYRFIHSMPIMSANASFDLLDPDLRPIQSELQYTATATIDPRKLSLVWHGFLTNTGIIRQPRPQELVLFAAEPWAHGPQVRNGDAAKIFLHEEHEGWLRGQEESSSLVKKNAGKVPVESPEEFEKAVRPAFGFWLVPMSALKDPEPSRVFSSPVCDLRGQNVELALAHLYE
ncbi:hypothetical protein HBH56_173280 [Parastagonospora nodorum]|uniref:2EXR domain-containing protein n=1 Tax=Phaeosphaeria nodorum (strain SN15 / ATCC MYA-4574 / FGSC 10173) TaxID=321614 RepID=A0A7U2HZS7_PHANO|nr:hypothetical protein HBH56_173280 [Parastagonospora nodorum]QRC96434.1 hypothetical protein JI435_433640 [Parastagonospora nodorum SN15]KAH3926223.1 hypothetical protein HBH54_169830 [Parastagonospora nodorum]KAH3971272.1 hypothetical protein HBH51_112010 [Parastagonospora nodorum]KAH4082861.1 hypothetical protein HBH46_218770 [Parastagonospora nodorum]